MYETDLPTKLNYFFIFHVDSILLNSKVNVVLR